MSCDAKTLDSQWEQYEKRELPDTGRAGTQFTLAVPLELHVPDQDGDRIADKITLPAGTKLSKTGGNRSQVRGTVTFTYNGKPYSKNVSIDFDNLAETATQMMPPPAYLPNTAGIGRCLIELVQGKADSSNPFYGALGPFLRNLDVQTIQQEERAAKFNFEYTPTLALIQALPSVKSGPEKVSLRPLFQKAGIKVLNQGNTPNCGTYATYYLLEYLLKKNNQKAMSFDQWTNALEQNGVAAFGSVSDLDTITTLARLYPHQFEIRDIKLDHLALNEGKFGSQALDELRLELLKEELRKGRPVLVSGPRINNVPKTARGIAHAALAVGFETKDGTLASTRIEILNSWGDEWGEKGYGWAGPTAGNIYSIQFHKLQ